MWVGRMQREEYCPNTVFFKKAKIDAQPCIFDSKWERGMFEKVQKVVSENFPSYHVIPQVSLQSVVDVKRKSDDVKKDDWTTDFLSDKICDCGIFNSDYQVICLVEFQGPYHEYFTDDDFSKLEDDFLKKFKGDDEGLEKFKKANEEVRETDDKKKIIAGEKDGADIPMCFFWKRHQCKHSEFDNDETFVERHLLKAFRKSSAFKESDCNPSDEADSDLKAQYESEKKENEEYIKQNEELKSKVAEGDRLLDSTMDFTKGAMKAAGISLIINAVLLIALIIAIIL